LKPYWLNVLKSRPSSPALDTEAEARQDGSHGAETCARPPFPGFS